MAGYAMSCPIIPLSTYGKAVPMSDRFGKTSSEQRPTMIHGQERSA